MFGEENFQYPLYRLSLFVFRTMFVFLTHSVLFYYMFHELSSKTFTFVVIVYSCKIIFTALWWGGLEVLRSSVRISYKSGNRDEINRIVGFWLVLALIITVPFLGFGAYYFYIWMHPYGYNVSSVESIYVVITCIALSLHFPISVFHAGIYAISRVIRPHFSVIISNIFGLSVLILFWPLIRINAIFLSILAQSLISSCLTYYYTHYMYKIYDLWPIKPSRNEFKKRIAGLPVAKFFIAGFANLMTNMDPLLIIGFYYFLIGKNKYIYLMQILYLISPLIQALSDWSTLFYFDRKKLDSVELTILAEKYDSVIKKVAWVMGFSMWGYSIIGCCVLISPEAGFVLFSLLPAFILRGIIADLHIKDFSGSYYFDVIVSGFMLLGGYTLVAVSKTPNIYYKSFYVTIVLIIVQSFLKRYRLSKMPIFKTETLHTNLYSWLSNIKSCNNLVEVCKLTLTDKAFFKDKITIIRRLVEALNLSGEQVCLYGKQNILIYFDITEKSILHRDSIFAELGKGLITQFNKELVFTNKLSFEKIKLDHSFIDCSILKDIAEKAFSKNNIQKFFLNDNEVVLKFFELFPQGVCYDPVKYCGPLAKPLPDTAIRRIFSLIWDYLYGRKNSSICEIDVTVLFDENVLRIIFLVPMQEHSRELLGKLYDWHQFIHSINIARAMHIDSIENFAPVPAAMRGQVEVVT